MKPSKSVSCSLNAWAHLKYINSLTDYNHYEWLNETIKTLHDGYIMSVIIAFTAGNNCLKGDQDRKCTFWVYSPNKCLKSLS